MICVLSTLPHQVPWCDAMADGLRRHGLEPRRVRALDDVEGEAVVCWGWRNGRALRERGLDVLVLERGYLVDRHRWSSAGWNGLNGRARFARGDGRRWARLGLELAPWRSGPGVALVIGQVPGDMAVEGLDIAAWTATTRARLEEMGHETRFRPHPLAAEPERTLAEDLAAASLVVTWNSNAGVDAAIAGVPVVALDAGSMARPVAGRELGDVLRPERKAWAEQLAWAQWTADEMASGETWEAVRTCR